MSTKAANALVIRPDDTGVHDSTVRVQATVGSNMPSHTAVRMDPSLKEIRDSLFVLHEVNMGYYGIKVVNPSPNTSFTGNTIRSLHTHGTAHIGVQLGENMAHASQIHSNQAEIRANTDAVYSEAVMQVWGSSNVIDLFSTNYGYQYGMKFELGSDSNRLINVWISAFVPVVDYGNNIVLSAASGASVLSRQPTDRTLPAVDSLLQNDQTESSLRDTATSLSQNKFQTGLTLETAKHKVRTMAVDLAIGELFSSELLPPLKTTIN